MALRLFRAIAVATTLAVGAVGGKSTCERLDGATAIFADMHDGDQKAVEISGDTLTIKPHGNDETWEVVSALDLTYCNASIDFNVPGKPSPPPVNLTAELWSMQAPELNLANYALKFVDHTGTVGTEPLNMWVQIA